MAEVPRISCHDFLVDLEISRWLKGTQAVVVLQFSQTKNRDARVYQRQWKKESRSDVYESV